MKRWLGWLNIWRWIALIAGVLLAASAARRLSQHRSNAERARLTQGEMEMRAAIATNATVAEEHARVAAAAGAAAQRHEEAAANYEDIVAQRKRRLAELRGQK